MDSFFEMSLGTRILVIVLVILVFLSLLITGILAWKLHTGKSDGSIGVNVTTGNVGVDIIDAEGNSLIGEVLRFVSVSGSDSNKLAPGDLIYTEGFRIKNCGSLDLDYIISISEDETVDSTEIREAFDIWVTDNPDDIETAVDLTSFRNSLKTDEISGTYYLVISMKETAGNAFQNKTYTGIGVTVTAVQSGGDFSRN